MNYLHQQKRPIIHRDLKSQNILVSNGYNLKVADFGLSHVRSNIGRKKKDELPKKHYGVYGTPEWMAPEVMCGFPYSEKVDVYAFGVLLCELTTRQAIYY